MTSVLLLYVLAILATVCSSNATVSLPDYVNRIFSNDRYPSGTSSRLLGSLYPSYEPSMRLESSAAIPGIVAEDLSNRIVYPRYMDSTRYDHIHYPHSVWDHVMHDRSHRLYHYWNSARTTHMSSFVNQILAVTLLLFFSHM